MTIHWGILSTAHINRRINPAIEQSTRGRLIGVASRDLLKAQIYAEECKIPKAYGSYEDLLADQEIQVVYNSLPNHLHTKWTILALEAGKHVLCEKPMSMTLNESDAIAAASEQTGCHVMEGYMHLYHPQTHLWKHIIDNGIIGEIHSLQSCFSFNLERPADNYRWRAEAGGGALWDVGIYPISLFQYLLNETPISVNVSSFDQDGIDLSSSVMLNYPRGITGQFFVSFRSSFSTDTFIHGSNGQLHISHPYTNPDECEAYIRKGNEIKKIEAPRQYLYSGEIEAMHDFILEGKKSIINQAFSKSILKTILNIKSQN